MTDQTPLINTLDLLCEWDQSTGLCACWSRYGLVSPARRLAGRGAGSWAIDRWYVPGSGAATHRSCSDDATGVV